MCCVLRIDHAPNVCAIADRRPIDPPPIVQLRVIDPAAQQAAGVRRRDSSAVSDPSSPALSSSSTARPHSDEDNSVAHSQSFLQNPYYFMFACLARPDDDAELHWLKVACFLTSSDCAHTRLAQDGRTRCTTGSVVSSLYHLKDPDHNNEGRSLPAAFVHVTDGRWYRSRFLCFSGS